MKHDLSITIVLVIFFLVAQIVGLSLINIDIQDVQTIDGKITVVHSETSLGPRPEMSGVGTFLYIAIGLLVGTILILLIIKMKKVNLWKAWFFLAVFLAISLSLGVFLNSYIAFGLAFILSVIKIAKPNVFVHNLTEVLMYAGIAVFLVPLLNVFWAAILLIAISIYDFIAVFKSKHMVKMAKFQTQSKVFAGLFVPYTPKAEPTPIIEGKKTSKASSAKELPLPKPEKKNAILGGGDIAFPLLFSGAVMESLVIKGLPLATALFQTLIITATTTIAVALLFFFAKKDKFYPAMPIISAGCFIGYGILLLL
jgi:presenilin-like A22 family membrane protease